ncbi:hypothetical protein Tco_1458937 [Tanacetum coccineum]
MAEAQGGKPPIQELLISEEAPLVIKQPSLVTEQVPLMSSALIVHTSKEKGSEKKTLEEEPPSKRLNLFQTTSSEYSPTPPKDENKGKGIATKEEPMKLLMPLIEQGGSDPKMLNLHQFSIFDKKLKKLSPTQIQAQAQKLAEFEAKRKKMLDEYNHYITYKADKLPITKISYKINRVTKDATIRIERNKQSLILTVYEKFVLKQLGFIEWIEIHALEFKVKSKYNDLMLKNLKAKFEYIKTQVEKVGILPPYELTAFRLSAAE